MQVAGSMMYDSIWKYQIMEWWKIELENYNSLRWVLVEASKCCRHLRFLITSRCSVKHYFILWTTYLHENFHLSSHYLWYYIVRRQYYWRHVPPDPFHAGLTYASSSKGSSLFAGDGLYQACRYSHASIISIHRRDCLSVSRSFALLKRHSSDIASTSSWPCGLDQVVSNTGRPKSE
jgi:hypothetical protein